MAYEVTKRIKGREYRYRVESVADAETGRTRTHWQYLGRMDEGRVIAPVRVYARRVTRDELIAATASLLQHRDAARVTVAVIAHEAGVSTGTFYRHFGDRRSALAAAIARLGEGLIRDLPSLDGPIGTPADEADRLFRWFATLHGGVLRDRALRWVLTGVDRETYAAILGTNTLPDELQALLTGYLRRLHDAGRAVIADPARLARALLRIHLSFVRDVALDGEITGDASPWGVIFPAIERAVFPHHRVAAESARERISARTAEIAASAAGARYAIVASSSGR